MPTGIARPANGVLESPEQLDLNEGRDVTVSIGDQPSANRAGRGMRAVAGTWRGTYDPEKLKLEIYAAQLGGHQSQVSRIA
jgi:hypothetical protein